MRHAARFGIAGLSALSLGLLAIVPGSFAPGAAAQAREPLCRRAAPLPPLPAEQSQYDQQQRHDGYPAPPRVVEPAKGYGPVMSAPPAPPPPPPPAPMEPYAESVEDSISVTGSRVGESRAATAPPPVADGDFGEARRAPGHYPRPPRPQPQSGLLTAGDHDDLLNPELYASYAGRFLQHSNLQGLPRLDTRRVLTVAVQDEAGRPVPFARV